MLPCVYPEIWADGDVFLKVYSGHCALGLNDVINTGLNLHVPSVPSRIKAEVTVHH